jgi:hypothetical protein
MSTLIRNEHTEIEPSPRVGRGAVARAWLGDAASATVYQWHHDSFVQLPPNAQLIASSPTCLHQAFVIGPHLAMQFHIEITPRKIQAWLDQPDLDYPAAVQTGVPSVQTPDAMHRSTKLHQPGSEALARHIYGCWRARWRPAQG